ncbi:helix-turn-helix transcriptional regulator [Pseudonocardia lacus]|uniref:helix-turn-helix transcriptional regulator n=1 Tax=Pseudonocardia lacus TaxID=2835865 RepID=UPI001BDCC92D|nr:LuxR C-terminal-related transcriptional regulator [Pseudonocardia lacus]
MQRVSTHLRVVLFGPDNLTVTAALAALQARGLAAERLVATDREPAHRQLAGPPGVLVVDLDAPGAVGVVRSVAAAGWTVVLLGGDAQHARIAVAVAAGAVAHVPKSAPFTRLLEVIEDGRPMPADERARWLDLYRSTQATVAYQVQRLAQLSSREREVLQHLVEGRRAADICAALFLSITTVRTHIRSILVKLEVNSQTQAVELYREVARSWPPRQRGPKRYA